MYEARRLRWPAQACPAIGMGGRLPRSALIWRGAIALALVLLLALAKVVVSSHETGPNSLSALPGGQAVAPGLDIGGTPSDQDLQALADSYQVRGVVNLAGPSVPEQAAAISLGQSYLHLSLAPGAAPAWPQLRRLAAFMRRQTAGGASVYLHDDVGGGRAIVAATMLLLLRGESWAAVSRGWPPGEVQLLSLGQMRAINQLISALSRAHPGRAANPYAAARLGLW